MFGMKVIPSGLCICNIFVQSSVYFMYFYQRIFDPKLCHFQKNVATQGVVCQVDISVLLMTTGVEKYLFYFPKILVLGVMSTTLPPSVTHIQYYTGHLTIILHKHEKFTFPVKKYWIIYISTGWVNVSVWESEYIWNVAM